MTETVHKDHYDTIIVGAGAAGMSLALALVKKGYSGSVLLLESNEILTNKKIWSFWYNKKIPTYIRDLIDYKWTKWSNSMDNIETSISCTTYPYCSIRASSLNQAIQKEVKSNANISLLLSQNVTEIYEESSFVGVTTPSRRFTASYLVDTRPTPLSLPRFGLWQSFYGIEVKTDKPAFLASTVKLMHDLKARNNGVEFFYILPFNNKHALIECTYFAQHKMSDLLLKERCETFIADLLGTISHQEVRVETGLLPMFNISTKMKGDPCSRIIRGGMTAGAMRASTGYSFSALQKWSSKIAQTLIHKEKLKPYVPISLSYRLMDKLMLKVVTENIHSSHGLFFQLSQRLDGDRFARFMSENATIVDILMVIYAMPKRLFLKSLFSRW